ncbi:MAG: hypothetical protein MJ010_05900 [Paludibacteraceae bacterium]|nr:hypothetical protein [Paludibacteraceae bacterium]
MRGQNDEGVDTQTDEESQAVYRPLGNDEEKSKSPLPSLVRVDSGDCFIG